MSAIDTRSPALAGGAASAGDDKQRLAMAARQFESLFTKQLLEALAGTKHDGAFQGMGSSTGMYDQMMHQAVADELAKGKGAGVAQMLYQRWTGESLPTEVVRMAPKGLGGSAERAISDTPTLDGPWAAPAGPVQPGRLVDDGVTPLRDLLPPTGLEPWLDKNLNPPIAAPDNPVGPPSLRAGEAHGHQVQSTDYNHREAVAGNRRDAAAEGLRPDRRDVVARYQRVADVGDR